MRLQIFDEGLRTAGSTIQQKHTLSHWSHLCLRVHKMKLLQINSNDSDTCQRVNLFHLKSVRFAHSSMIGWTIDHFDQWRHVTLPQLFHVGPWDYFLYGSLFLPVKKKKTKIKIQIVEELKSGNYEIKRHNREIRIQKMWLNVEIMWQKSNYEIKKSKKKIKRGNYEIRSHIYELKSQTLDKSKRKYTKILRYILSYNKVSMIYDAMFFFSFYASLFLYSSWTVFHTHSHWAEVNKRRKRINSPHMKTKFAADYKTGAGPPSTPDCWLGGDNVVKAAGGLMRHPSTPPPPQQPCFDLRLLLV